jgi:hypothetical protein
MNKSIYRTTNQNTLQKKLELSLIGTHSQRPIKPTHTKKIHLRREQYPKTQTKTKPSSRLYNKAAKKNSEKTPITNIRNSATLYTKQIN